MLNFFVGFYVDRFVCFEEIWFCYKIWMGWIYFMIKNEYELIKFFICKNYLKKKINKIMDVYIGKW